MFVNVKNYGAGVEWPKDFVKPPRSFAVMLLITFDFQHFLT